MAESGGKSDDSRICGEKEHKNVVESLLPQEDLWSQEVAAAGEVNSDLSLESELESVTNLLDYGTFAGKPVIAGHNQHSHATHIEKNEITSEITAELEQGGAMSKSTTVTDMCSNVVESTIKDSTKDKIQQISSKDCKLSPGVAAEKDNSSSALRSTTGSGTDLRTCSEKPVAEHNQDSKSIVKEPIEDKIRQIGLKSREIYSEAAAKKDNSSSALRSTAESGTDGLLNYGTCAGKVEDQNHSHVQVEDSHDMTDDELDGNEIKGKSEGTCTLQEQISNAELGQEEEKESLEVKREKLKKLTQSQVKKMEANFKKERDEKIKNLKAKQEVDATRERRDAFQKPRVNNHGTLFSKNESKRSQMLNEHSECKMVKLGNELTVQQAKKLQEIKTKANRELAEKRKLFEDELQRTGVEVKLNITKIENAVASQIRDDEAKANSKLKEIELSKQKEHKELRKQISELQKRTIEEGEEREKVKVKISEVPKEWELKLTKQDEEQAILEMMQENELKIQAYIELEDKRKKCDERVKEKFVS